jgi:hypothetical protein
MNFSPLIAADGYYFFLDEKVTKNQDEKILPRTKPLPIGPGFSSGQRSSNLRLCIVTSLRVIARNEAISR